MNKQKTNDSVAAEEKPFLKVIVHSFFIIPFLIAVFCVLLFTAINLLTREKRTAYDYLEDVKTGGITKRWQGAFELSKIIANEKVNDDPRFIQELVNAFKSSTHDDNRVRQYLALAMGKTKNTVYNETLIQALKEEKEENLPSIIYAIGMLADTESAVHLHPFLKNENARIRSIAAVSLGNIANNISVPFLQGILSDSEPNVQWGAAISLARMGNTSGREVVLKLLNRQYLAQFEQVDSDEQTNLILTAIEASHFILNEELRAKIKDLSVNDQNMKIRSEAMKVLSK